MTMGTTYANRSPAQRASRPSAAPVNNPSGPAVLDAGAVLRLQRLAGNRAVVGALKSQPRRLQRSRVAQRLRLQRDQGSDDFKQGYQDGLSGGADSVAPREGDSATDYEEGYAKGHYEYGQQGPSGPPAADSPPAVADAPAPTPAGGDAGSTAPAPQAGPAPAPAATPTPGSGPDSTPDSDDYKQGYQDGTTGAEDGVVPRDGQAASEYEQGYAKGHTEFTQKGNGGAPPGSEPNSTPDSDDYKQGYQDGTSGAADSVAPRDGQAATDYEQGYTKGHQEYVQQGAPAPQGDGSSQSAAVPDCLVGFDVTTAGASDKILKAIACAGPHVGETIGPQLEGAIDVIVGLTIAYTIIQFIPVVDATADAILLAKLGLAAYQAHLTVEMVKGIADDVATFIGAATAKSNDDIEKAGKALAHGVDTGATVIILDLLGIGPPEDVDGVDPSTAPEGTELPAARKGEFARVTVDKEAKGDIPPNQVSVDQGASPVDGTGGEATNGSGSGETSPASDPTTGGTAGTEVPKESGSEDTKPAQSDATMSDGSAVAAEANSPDGSAEVKVGQNGTCEVCASPCDEIHAKFPNALQNADLAGRVDGDLQLKDPQETADAVAKDLPDLQKAEAKGGSTPDDQSSTKYNRDDLEVSRNQWKALVEDALKRDPTCPYCQARPSVTADHVEPLVDADAVSDMGMMTQEEAAGAANDPSNLRGICQSCNSSKAGHPPGDATIDPSWWTPPKPDAALIAHMKQMGRWPW
jgi:5-methylcytosine-specific restriction endonuclease McrA